MAPLPGLRAAARAHRTGRSAVAIVLVALLVVVMGGAARAADPRLEEARGAVTAAQDEIDRVAERIEAVRADMERTRTNLERLRAQVEDRQQEAGAADRLRAQRVRESYISGNGDPVLRLLTATDRDRVLEQARFMAWMSVESRRDMEAAASAATRTTALAERAAAAEARLEDQERELEQARADAEGAFTRAQQAQEDVEALVAREERDARARRAAAATASRSRSFAGQRAGTAAPSGGVACPMAGPRSYVNSWGAARSGGRAHKGTDILGPYGTPVAAYESGVITRTKSSSLGGITLYLRGDSGNVYYYAHLAGYAVGSGARVSAGQVIAYNGDSGNARGIPHIHFEVSPGGGGNVNPYPYVRRACG